MLCFIPYVADITFLSYFCLKFTLIQIFIGFFLMYLPENDDISKMGNIYLLINVKKLIIKVN